MGSIIYKVYKKNLDTINYLPYFYFSLKVVCDYQTFNFFLNIISCYISSVLLWYVEKASFLWFLKADRLMFI